MFHVCTYGHITYMHMIICAVRNEVFAFSITSCIQPAVIYTFRAESFLQLVGEGIQLH